MSALQRHKGCHRDSDVCMKHIIQVQAQLWCHPSLREHWFKEHIVHLGRLAGSTIAHPQKDHRSRSMKIIGLRSTLYT
eukprot:1162125-Pelagomonas_calceolata.AAC.8